MIILPDKNIPRSKYLMPVKRSEWYRSQKPEYTQDKMAEIIFSIKARLNDGKVVWRGEFFDRDDFDAFLYAIANETLQYEKDLWNLPIPNWSPYIGENLSYEMTTTIFLPATSGTLNTNISYVFPNDWSVRNEIHCIGAGGGGGCSFVNISGYTGTRLAQGGQGGSYGLLSNATQFAPGSTTTYRIGRRGEGGFDTNSGTTAAVGGNAGDTYFGGTSYSLAPVGCGGGFGGNAGTGTGISALGVNSRFKGTSGFSGGGSASLNTTNQTSGGGGAAGPLGPGGSGTNTGASRGGTGNGGTVTGSGTTGTYFSAVSPFYGPGSGGNSGGGFGGRFGGGGGGRSTTISDVAGPGFQGLVVLQYEPSVGQRFFGRPMSGL